MQLLNFGLLRALSATWQSFKSTERNS